jgi:hypothetical protein
VIGHDVRGASMADEEPSGPVSGDLVSSNPTLATLGEDVLDQVEGLGATLIITPTRAVLVRQGAQYRPRSGVRSWPYSTLRDVQVMPPRHGNGRVVIRLGPYPWQAVNLFVDTTQWTAAERVVAKIRAFLSEARRSQRRNVPHS